MTLLDSIALQQLLERNIRTALYDYNAHTRNEVLYTDDFVKAMAREALLGKADLRELFRKSPAWNEELQALVINGNRTHEPDPYKVRSLAKDIFDNNWAVLREKYNWYDLVDIADWFAFDDATGFERMESIAPKAYANGRKKSKVFRKVCEALGIIDDSQGSFFQKHYAMLADELSARPIDFKLYVSINPAHFLTMSNPKEDRRGETMTSCHSLNSNYSYRAGCSGYARDDVSIIAFTADPSNPETLNNRKTSRQMYAYKVGSGVLMQSRLYHTRSGDYGGTDGEQPETKLYRDLIEREISECESVPNLWKVLPSTDCSDWVQTTEDFLGYPDFEYSRFAPHICLRADHTEEILTVGAESVCFSCGSLYDSAGDDTALNCEDCGGGQYTCDHCGYSCSHTTAVRSYRGYWIDVCDDCLGYYYYQCEGCGEYHHRDNVTWIGDDVYCEECRNDRFSYCEMCEEWYPIDEVTYTADCRNVCDDCLSNYYTYCDICGEWHPNDEVEETADGKHACRHCRENHYIQCSCCMGWYRGEDIRAIPNEETGEVRFVCTDCIEENQENEEVA